MSAALFRHSDRMEPGGSWRPDLIATVAPSIPGWVASARHRHEAEFGEDESRERSAVAAGSVDAKNPVSYDHGTPGP